MSERRQVSIGIRGYIGRPGTFKGATHRVHSTKVELCFKRAETARRTWKDHDVTCNFCLTHLALGAGREEQTAAATRKVGCVPCHGSGVHWQRRQFNYARMAQCTHCHGKGYVVQPL